MLTDTASDGALHRPNGEVNNATLSRDKVQSAVETCGITCGKQLLRIRAAAVSPEYFRQSKLYVKFPVCRTRMPG